MGFTQERFTISLRALLFLSCCLGTLFVQAQSADSVDFCGGLKQMMAASRRPAPLEASGFEARVLSQEKNTREAPNARLEHYQSTVFECANNLKDLVFHDQTAGLIFPGQMLWSGLLIQGNVAPASEITRLPYRVTLTGVRASGQGMTNLSFDCSGPFSSYESGLQRAVNSIGVTAPQFTYSFTDNESNEAGLLKLGVSAKYLGGSASASMRRQEGTFKSIKYLSFDQTFFTAVIDTPAPCSFIAEPAGSADHVLQQVRSRVNEGHGELAYVSRVNYGRRLLICISSDRSQKELDRALRFKYSGATFSLSGSTEQEAKQIWAGAQVTAVVIGGESKPALIKAFTDDPGNLLINISSFLSETVSFTNTTVAVPVSFQAQYWRDNGGCTVVQTAKYAGEKVIGYVRKGGDYTYSTPDNKPLQIPPPAGKRSGDGEMDTGDSCVKLSLSYRASITPDRREIELRFTYVSQEYEGNCRKKKDSRFESVAVVKVPAPDTRDIKSILSPRRGVVTVENSGQNWDFIPMSGDTSGVIRSASGRTDARGREDYSVFEARCHYSIRMQLADGPLEAVD